MTPITESFLLIASATDILKAPARLAAIPYDGILTIEACADKCTNTNNVSLTIRTPDGDVPMENEIIGASGYAGADDDLVMHDDTEFMMQLPAGQGGHFSIDVTEKGTAHCLIRATLTPMETYSSQRLYE